MNYIQLFSPVIRKSDGNLMMWNGQFHVQRHPPPEAFGVAGKGEHSIDAPPFAHTGGHDEHETEMQGVGHLIPGKFNLEPDSKALYWEDEFGGKHYHGIDGVIHHLHNFLVKNGIETPEAASKLVQRAIEEKNKTQPEENHLPNITSPEWRRIAVGDYQKNDDERRHHIMHDGEKKLQTAHTNWHKESSPYGTFIDSLTVPFYKELKQLVQQEYGFDDKALSGRKTQFLNYPYIHRFLLSYGVNPQTQEIFHNGDSYKPGHFKGGGGHAATQGMMNTMREAGMTVDQAFSDINSHSIAHDLPDEFYRKKTQGMGKDSAASRMAMEELMMAMGNHPEVGNALSSGKLKQTINPQEHPALSNTTYKGHKLSDIVSHPQALQLMLNDLQLTGAFMKIYGRTTKASHHNKLMNAATELHTGGETDEEADLLDYAGLRGHVGTRSGQKGRHHAAGNVFALKLASGRHPEMEDVAGNSNLRHTNIPPELLDKHGVRLQEHTPEEIQEHRGAIEALSEYIADSQGLPTRQPFPAELPSQPVTPHTVTTGQYQGGVLASYIPYSGTDIGAIGDTDSRVAHSRGETSITPQTSPMEQTTTMTSPARRQTAVMRRPTPKFTGQLGSVNPFGSENLPGIVRDMPQQTGMTPEQLAQIRQSAAGMTPEQLERIQAAGGARGFTPENTERFRSAFSDPAQRFLTEYMKGQTDMAGDAQDRIIKAIEDIQMLDAKNDDSIAKYVGEKSLSIDSEYDVSKISKMLGIAPQDVRVIHNAKGDWLRLTKSFGFSEKVVKIVKVSFGGLKDD